ncbi:MAG TPA: lipid-A-disaccharide synthase N-terminal domain-containing protein [Bacillota bacterium]|nr:lipid-A-disaccharide synthase N-terminal domain-containing protein [Bacillota bacterium]
MDWLKKPDHIWVAIGFIGQLVFGARFYVQWLASERAKKSIVPVSFWYLSIVGSFTLLAYAIYRMDPVFIIGQLFGTSIYFRNIALLKKENAGRTSNETSKSV